MRVLHLSSEYPPQTIFGLGRYVNELAEAQASAGHQVTVLTNSLGGDDDDSVVNGVRIRRVHFPPPPKATNTSAMLLHFNLQLLDLVWEIYGPVGLEAFPDIINVHDWLTVTAGFHLGRMLKAPVVTTIHDVVFNKVRHRPFDHGDAFVAGLENWACHFSSRLIVLSQAVAAEVESSYHADPSRVSIIPGGVGLQPLADEEFADLAKWRRAIARDDEHLLLFVGRLDPEKGCLTLLDACHHLNRMQDKPWKLALAGTGTFEQTIDKRTHELGLQGRVFRLGYLGANELRTAFTAADIVVVPSTYEPFGLVSLEAQRVGTPVVVSATGGLAEILGRTQGGLQFPPNDPIALAELLTCLLDDEMLCKRLGAAGLQQTKNLFSWAVLERDVERAYRQALESSAKTDFSIPAWTIPDARRHAEPVVDFLVIWEANEQIELDKLLACLIRLRPLGVLRGKVHVLLQPTEGHPSWNATHAWVQSVSLTEAKLLLDRLAGVIVDDRLRGSDLFVDAKSYPVVWYGNARTHSDGNGHFQIRTMEHLYAITGKLLCDNSFRRMLAPRLKYSCSVLDWHQPARSRPLILHLLPQLVTGGAETTLLEIVKGTSDAFSHCILSLGPLEGPLPDEFRRLDVPIERIPSNNISLTLSALQRIRPNLLHLHSMSYFANWIGSHRRLGNVPIIETEHVVNIGSGHFGRVDKVICVSNATRAAHNRFIEQIGNQATTFDVVYNGINPADFDGLPSLFDARKLLGIPTDRPIIGRVSALARNKLPLEALEAFQIINLRMPEALFVVVGDGNERARVENWVRSKGLSSVFLFLGERRDIPQILSAFDVFAYYTTKDALGNVILEAAAAGIPVVTTDVEGTREALGEAPGACVRLGDLNSFANEVIRYVKQSRSRTRTKKALEECFTRAGMSRRYKKIYSEFTSIAANDDVAIATELLIKFPTRARPDRFFATLDRYRTMLSGNVRVRFVISCDTDDTSMNNADVKERLRSIPGVSVCFGDSRTKVEAINADLEDERFTAMLLASDDMLPQVQGYDQIILKRMRELFSDTDGVLFFNDGFRGRRLNTLPIIGYRYYQRFKYIYYPGYKSLWCDNEFTDVAARLGRHVYFDEILFRHEHPANTGKGADDLYRENDRHYVADQQLYYKRKVEGFGVPAQVALSIVTSDPIESFGHAGTLSKALMRHIAGVGLGESIEVLPAASPLKAVDVCGDFVTFFTERLLPQLPRITDIYNHVAGRPQTNVVRTNAEKGLVALTRSVALPLLNCGSLNDAMAKVYNIAGFSETENLQPKASVDLKSIQPRRVLWLRTDAIGDGILASGMLPALRQRFPEAEITVLCQDRTADLYSACPHVDAFISFNRSDALKHGEYLKRILSQLTHARFDLAINSVYSREALSDVLALHSGAAVRIAPIGDAVNQHPDIGSSQTAHYEALLPSSTTAFRSELQRHEDLLRALGIEGESPVRPLVWLSPSDEAWAESILRDNSIEHQRFIALFAGALNPIRRFSGFGAALARICLEKNLAVIGLGAEADHEINEQNLRAITGVRTINLSGLTRLGQSIAVLKRARLAVGSETGLAHAACALNVSNVILLGGGHFGRFMPYSPSTSIVSMPMNCYGCNWTCIHPRPYCITDLPVQRISYAIEDTLARPNTGRVRMYSANWPSGPATDVMQFLSNLEVEICEDLHA